MLARTHIARTLAASVFAIAALLSVPVAANSAGFVDTSFGKNGFALAQLSHYPNDEPANEAKAALVDRSGRLILGGYRANRSLNAMVNNFALVAFDQRGHLDPTWGSSGKIIESFPRKGRVNQRDAEASALAIGPNGRIYAAGLVDDSTDRDVDKGYDTEGEGGGDLNISRLHYVVFAYDTRGRRIRSFGQNGQAKVKSVTKSWSLDSPTQLFDIAVAPNGAIYLFGEDDYWNYRVFRLTPQGRLDRSFGHGGNVKLPSTTDIDEEGGPGVRLFADDSGVIVTYATTVYGKKSARAAWYAMRLTRHGATDRGYGTNGRFRKAWSVGTGDTGVTHVERDYAGRLLFAGTYGVSGSSPRVEHGAVLRLTPDGKPDASFAVNGIFTPLNDDGTGQPVAGIAPTSDGSYVLAVSTCPLNFDPDGDNKCKGTFKTRELDSTGFPNPLWGVGGNGDLPGNFDHIIRMIASENHLYAAFGEVWATLNSPTRFGALRITR